MEETKAQIEENIKELEAMPSNEATDTDDIPPQVAGDLDELEGDK